MEELNSMDISQMIGTIVKETGIAVNQVKADSGAVR